ncbi:MAG: prepilin peptidase [Candidatus Korobacteraceae bacterium]
MDLQALNRIVGGVVFAFGLIFGSFLNVCIYRMPRGLSVVSPRSACPKCGKQIAAYDNVPVLSWLWLRGHCRHCHTRITPRYMIVELTLGLLFFACFAEFGLQAETLKWCTFSFLLLGLIFTDAETHLLPDKLTLPGLALGFAWSLMTVVPGPLGFYFNPGASRAPLLSLGDAFIGATVGAGLIYGTAAIYLRLRGVEGMGLGDVKLMAMVGAFLGAPLTLFVLATASIFGGLFGAMVVFNIFRKRLLRYRRSAGASHQVARAWQSASLSLRFYEIPFGVLLGSMAFFALFAGQRFLIWYLGRF